MVRSGTWVRLFVHIGSEPAETRKGAYVITLDVVSKRYPNGTFALRDVDLHADMAEEAGETAQAVLQQLVEGDRLTLRPERARFDPAEAEQVGHEPVQSLRLVGMTTELC